MLINFTCPFCGNTFGIDNIKINPNGHKGTCKKCNNSLVVFPDGRIIPFSQFLDAQSKKEDKKEDSPIWKVRLKATETVIPGGPFTLKQILEFILEDKVTEDDEAMIVGVGEWLPLRAIPAMEPLLQKKVLLNREKFGDSEHCVNHHSVESKFYCPKCKKFFCKNCSVNKPFVAGGAPHYVCKDCDIDLLEIKKKSSILSSIFGAKTKK